MGKYSGTKATKGSQKHIQTLINISPDLLTNAITAGISQKKPLRIDWVSPVSPRYYEYSDGDFLKILGLSEHISKLEKFWPTGGPHWDALGKDTSGRVFLVEAKAHIDEIVTPGTGATALSKKRIIDSLNQVKRYLKNKDNQPWHEKFYQYANRVAHLYFLRVICGVDAYLIFVNFLNDKAFPDSPKTQSEWEAAIRVVETYLSLRSTKLSQYVIHTYFNVQSMAPP